MASRRSVIGSILTRLKISLSRSKDAITGDQWESARAAALNLPPKFEGGQELQNREIEKLETTTHWLSAACFLEGVNPRGIRLEPLLAERLILETRQLEELDPLEASTICFKIGRVKCSTNTDLEE